MNKNLPKDVQENPIYHDTLKCYNKVVTGVANKI